MEKLKNDLIQWLKDYLVKSSKNGYTLGVSGGLDSAICAKLLILGEIPATFVILPNDDSMNESKERAIRSVCTERGDIQSTHIIDINEIISVCEDYLWWQHFNFFSNYNWAIANLQSRVRANILYTIAQTKNQLVLGTTNKSENFIGYFTKGGDGLSDLEPLINIPKTYLYKFAEYLEIDKEIIEAKPAAELGISKTDEDEMGYTYEQLDTTIEAFEKDELRDNSIQQKIMNDHYKSEFKRHLPEAFPFKMQ